MIYRKKFIGVYTVESEFLDTQTIVYVAVYHIYLFGIQVGTAQQLIKNC